MPTDATTPANSAGRLPRAGLRDAADRVEHALARGQAQGEELEHRRQLGGDAGQASTRPALQHPVTHDHAECCREERHGERGRRRAASRTSARAPRVLTRVANAPAAQASCSPRNRSTLDADPAWRSRRAIASCAAEPLGDERAEGSRERGDHQPEHRARIGGSPGEQRSRFGRDVGDVGRDPFDQPRAADARGRRDDEPEAESEEGAQHHAESCHGVQRNHRRSSGRRPSATMAW